MNEQQTLPVNPAWSAPVVVVDGRTWLDATGAALMHPSASGQVFRIDDHEYLCVEASRMGGLVRVTTGSDVPVLLPLDRRCLIEVHP